MAALPSSSGVPSKLLLMAVPLTRVRLRGLGWVGGSIRRTQRGGGAHVSPAARRADEQSQCWAASTAPKVRASLQGCAGARRVVGDASVASSPNAAILSRCDRPPVGALVTPALAAAPPPTLLFATTRWLSAQLCFTAAFGALRHRSSSPLSGASSKLSFPPAAPFRVSPEPFSPITHPLHLGHPRCSSPLQFSVPPALLSPTLGPSAQPHAETPLQSAAVRAGSDVRFSPAQTWGCVPSRRALVPWVPPCDAAGPICAQPRWVALPGGCPCTALALLRP